MQRDKTLIDRAVVAPVENEYLRASCNLAGQADGEPVRVGRGKRELPILQAKALLQIFGYKHGIFRGQHERNAALCLLFNGLDRGKRRVARHRPRIAEAKIDVAMAVQIVKMRALRFAHHRRKRACPFHHPVHGYAGEHRFLAALKNGFGFWAFVDVALLLALHQGLEAVAI